MVRRLLPLVLVASCAAGAFAADPALEPEGSKVEVRRETIVYPVNQKPPPDRYAYLKVNPALAGKDEYATEAIVLENEYLAATVLPEFGARLVRVTFKKPRRDVFWINDVLEDHLPWSMGGTRFTFPFYEHGRHLDEGAGFRVIEGPDGSATVALDMRFSQYAGETQRYGRFSTLRQATIVRLRPGEALLEYTLRVDNPLPVRHGFRSWNVAHFARKAGAHLLFPVGGVTGHGAPSLDPWPVWDETDHRVLGTWGTSRFTVDLQGDWAGVYYPGADANHLLLRPRFTVPGLKLYASRLRPDQRGRWDSMIEIWSGSNRVFEHPGHYLPPFGTYVLPLRVTMIAGIGKVHWANDEVAVAYDPGDETRGPVIRIAGFRARARVSAVARGGGAARSAEGPLGPDRPLVLELGEPAREVFLVLRDEEGDEIAEVRLPWKPEPTDPKAFEALKAEMERDWLSMELSDWPREHAPNLASAAEWFAKNVSSDDPESVVHAARIMMRTEAPGSERWTRIREMLRGVLRTNPDHAYANLYLGMMRTLEAGGLPSEESVAHVRKAARLPGAQFLMALESIHRGKRVVAVKLLDDVAAHAPPVAMGMGKRALQGNERLHPAATLDAAWPTLLKAAVLLGMDRPRPAVGALELLLLHDPARPEAMALLAEALEAAGEDEKAAAARADADTLFLRNPRARRDLDALRRQAETGELLPIAKP